MVLLVQDIFLVTKLQPGEKPLDALKEMLASSPTNEIRRYVSAAGAID